MTTYAYPITLKEELFDNLYDFLQKICDESERNGDMVYDSDTKKPIGNFSNILEIMKEAKGSIHRDANGFASAITFTLTDYLFIPLENLLKEKCWECEDESGRKSFNQLTDNLQLDYSSILKATRFAIENAALNSWSSITDTNQVNLWSPKKLDEK